MYRIAFALALVAALPACKKTQAGPTTVATDSATDGSAMLEVEFAYEPKGNRELELIFSMRAVGVEQMDKIVLQVEVGDFHVIDGSSRWTGFVPPRDPKRHSVLLRATEGNDAPTVTVKVTRSHDSSPLMSRTLAFTVDDGQLRAE